MSSTSVSSSATSEPTPRPLTSMPQVDLAALARTTRKTLERLVAFSHMRTASSEVSPSLTKIINKINRYTTLIDSSILCEQLGYQLANNCMILCDPELSVGLSTPNKNDGVATRGRGGAWTPVSRQPAAADAYVFGREDAHELAGQGYEIALKVKDGFNSITQEMYKIAASTKDDMLDVLVPPDPTHSETLKIHLKDVGINLVASLSLFSEFSKAVSEIADWWILVKDDLALEKQSLLLGPIDEVAEKGLGDEKFAWWSEMKDDFQEYYDVINVVHLRFPELLPSSSAAWQTVVLRTQVANSTGHLDNPHQLQGNSGTKKSACLGSFMSVWKKDKREEDTKPKKWFGKRKESKEKVKCEGIEKTTEAKGSPQSSSSMGSSSSSSPVSPKPVKEEKTDSKVRMR